MITLLEISPYTGDLLVSSPNHDARRASAIEGIVLHATGDDGDEALALSWLRSPTSHVSCHLLVGRDGQVMRLVGDRQRAWHAGLAWWRGTSDVNSITLGIEIANRNDGERYTAEQYQRVAEIVAHYCRQGLTLEDVVSHQEIASDRKNDPFGWKWDRFRTMVQDHLSPIDVERATPRAEPTVEQSRPVDVEPSAPRTEQPVESRNEAISPPAKQPWARSVTPAGAPGSFAPQHQTEAANSGPKPLICSRTLWLNVVTVLAAIGMIIGDTLDLSQRVGFHLSENVTKWALFAVGMVNIILRLRTTQPLGRNQTERQHARSNAAYAARSASRHARLRVTGQS